MTAVRFTKRWSVVDADCEFRPCFREGFDKGPFVPGRGYTNPGAVHRPVCLTRHLHGCPHAGAHLVCGACRAVLGLVLGPDDERDLPETPDACEACGSANVYWLTDVLPAPRLCCEMPSVRRVPSGFAPYTQTCRSCGTKLRGERLRLAREASWPSGEYERVHGA